MRTVYMADDGSIHELAEEALAHESGIMAKRRFVEWARANAHHFSEDAEDNICLYPEDIPQFIRENWDAVAVFKPTKE